MEIILYTTHCPKCKVLETKLRLKGIKYAEVDNIDEMTALGIQSAPFLSVNGQLMDFGAAVKWVNAQEFVNAT